MSASSKKKLRKEQNAAQLTEKQLQQQKEAKKLKVTTTTFVVVMVLVLAIALGTAGVQMFNRSGINERNTLALTVNDHELNNAELNYFYIDGINRFYNNWYTSYGSYAALYLQMYGLDLSQPLNEQYYDLDGATTWAEYFVEMAVADATDVYAQYDKAVAEGFTLTAEQQESLDTTISSLKDVAKDNNFGSINKYLQAFYGPGSSEESYVEYLTATTTAQAYANAYYETLSFTDADIRAYDAEHAQEFNSYTYSAYYLSATDFREGGTVGEDGTTTYTDEEKAAAIEKAKETAESLLTAKTRKELDLAIGALDINADAETPVASTYYENQAYGSVTDTLLEWVTDPSRQSGEIDIVPSITTTTNEDGTETTTTNGYYVVLFEAINDNTGKMATVRHLLVEFEGGSTSDGETVYTQEEKDAAKAVADALLNEWKMGEATEDSFADLVLLNTDDTASAATGGLYENIYDGAGYVDEFEDWALDTARVEGETAIVETPYGYHIMYYVSTGEHNFRDYQIVNALESDAMTVWYDEVKDAATVVNGDTKYLKRDLTLMSSY